MKFSLPISYCQWSFKIKPYNKHHPENNERVAITIDELTTTPQLLGSIYEVVAMLAARETGLSVSVTRI